MEAVREVDTLLSPFADGLEKEPNCFISINHDYSEEHEFAASVPILWDGVLPESVRATYCGDENRRWIKLHGFRSPALT